MKNIFMIAKNSLDKNKIITTMILLIFSLLIVCQNSAFIFNPFILVLLCISYVISFFTLIMIGTSSSIIAFIIDKRYGLELIIITLILIVLYYISTLIKKDLIKIYLPCVVINLIIFIVYLLTSDSVFYAINSFVLVLLSLIFSYYLTDLILKKKKGETPSQISLSLGIIFIVSSFIKVEQIMFVVLIFSLIFLLRLNKNSLFLMTAYFSFFIFYLFSEISINILMSIYLSLFILGLLRFKYNYFFFIPIVSLFMFSINETFYNDHVFYQVLIGFVLVNVVPQNIILKVDKVMFEFTSDKLSKIIDYQNNKLNDISLLCDLLMDDRFDKFEGLDKVLEKVIKKEVCSKCPSTTCSINISKYLSGYLSNNEKTEIVKDCLYPYQLTKEISTANKRIIDYSEREVKSVESKKIMNKTYEIIRQYIDLVPSIKMTTKNYSLDVTCLTKEAKDSPNGDAYKIYNDDYNSKILLSDGMGHTNKSKEISEYVIELINYLHLISNDAAKSIQSCNQIVLAKTYEEVYATLDMCEFDLEKGNASIYKVGSFPCYLIRNKKVREISTKLPPIGIIGNIKVEPETIELFHNDTLIFLTDGFGEQVKDLIESTIQKTSFLSLKNYVKFLFNRLNENSDVEDDKTIIGVKIIKN